MNSAQVVATGQGRLAKYQKILGELTNAETCSFNEKIECCQYTA